MARVKQVARTMDELYREKRRTATRECMRRKRTRERERRKREKRTGGERWPRVLVAASSRCSETRGGVVKPLVGADTGGDTTAIKAAAHP